MYLHQVWELLHETNVLLEHVHCREHVILGLRQGERERESGGGREREREREGEGGGMNCGFSSSLVRLVGEVYILAVFTEFTESFQA